MSLPLKTPPLVSQKGVDSYWLGYFGVLISAWIRADQKVG